MLVTGLAPYLPAHRPRATPRWWVATGDGEIRLHEQATLPDPTGRLAIAAPCSLPEEFLDYLGEPPGSMTTNRLLARAREFARERERGKKHPRRSDDEVMSALDRRRLPLFHAALPLLDQKPIEVEAAAMLRALDLPHSKLAGDHPDAIERRRTIVDSLPEITLAPRDRDLAVATHHALFALIAASVASGASQA